MQRRLLILTSALILSIGTFAAAPMVAEMGVAEMVEPERTVTLNVEGKSVMVSGAAGMTLEVVSVTGRNVASIKIDSPAQRVELNLPKGCYILKIGKVVRKITVR
jgi:hypothetical protein